MACGILEFEVDSHLKTAGDGDAIVVPSGGELPLPYGSDGRCFEVAWRIRLLDGWIYDTSFNIDDELQNDKSLDVASACIFWIMRCNLLQWNGWMLERLPVGHAGDGVAWLCFG